MLDYNKLGICEPATLEEASSTIAELIDMLRSRETEQAWSDKRLLLYLKESGEVELWGPRQTPVFKIEVRDEIEQIDYSTTPNGLDYSGLALLAKGYASPRRTIADMARWLRPLFMLGGEPDPVSALAQAWYAVVRFLARRRFPFVMNIYHDAEAVQQVEKLTNSCVMEECNEALYAATAAASNRERENERSRIRRTPSDNV
jgi:hypothetical protein